MIIQSKEGLVKDGVVMDCGLFNTSSDTCPSLVRLSSE